MNFASVWFRIVKPLETPSGHTNDFKRLDFVAEAVLFLAPFEKAALLWAWLLIFQRGDKEGK